MYYLNLINLLPPGAHPFIFAHLQQWFQPGNTHANNTGVAYDSSDPLTIAQQIRAAQAVGINGFIVDWYGPEAVNPFGHQALKTLLLVASVLDSNFRIGVCVDKGACEALVAKDLTWQQAFDECMSYIALNYTSSPAFWDEYVLEFGCGAKAEAAGTPINFAAYSGVLHDNAKYGKFFTWVLPNAASQAQRYSDPNCVMGSVCAHFNDASVSNPAVGVWGGAPRLLDSNLTMQNWAKGWSLIPAGMKFVQIVTWNDYEERTAIEGEIALLNGQVIQ